mmetsp:Transcript_3893/g.4577  ORF Transcript_3893/g.4577 Transcript_3893/m.4577 type:complete len:310 (+) Transcript_3893:1470-2399(+)
MDDDRGALLEGLLVGVLEAAISVSLDDELVVLELGLLNDVDLVGDGGSSGGLITSDHDDLHTGSTALLNRGVDLGARRIVKGDKTDKGEAPHGEPSILVARLIPVVDKLRLVVTEGLPVGGVEGVALGELARLELSLGEGEDTLTHQAKAIVGSLYIVLHAGVVLSSVKLTFSALEDDLTAALEDLLGGTLKVDGDVVASMGRVPDPSVGVTDHEVELDAGVERNLVAVFLGVLKDGEGFTELVESVLELFVLRHVPDTIVLIHEEGSDEAHETGLGGVTLSQSLHEALFVLLHLHLGQDSFPLFLMCW